MERALVTVQIVEEINPIENADRIEQIKVMGWNLIAKKGEFQVGGKCIFFEIDSILPDNNPIFDFMEKVHYRVKTMKMRGVMSQGLAMPLNLLGIDPDIDLETDLTSMIGVEKWEPASATMGGIARGNFPFFVPKTDEIRIQSKQKVLVELHGVHAISHVKLDGTSMTISNLEDDIQVCSRNMSLKEANDSVYWQVANKLDIPNKLRGMNVAIQGELVGPKIQGNKLGLGSPTIYVFDVWDIDRRQYYSSDSVKYFCASHFLNMVPIDKHMPNFDHTLDELLEMAKGRYENGNLREGIVVRPEYQYVYSEVLNDRLSFKVINNDFLLEYER